MSSSVKLVPSAFGLLFNNQLCCLSSAKIIYSYNLRTNVYLSVSKNIECLRVLVSFDELIKKCKMMRTNRSSYSGGAIQNVQMGTFYLKCRCG